MLVFWQVSLKQEWEHDNVLQTQVNLTNMENEQKKADF